MAGLFPVHIYDYMYNYSVQQDDRRFSCSSVKITSKRVALVLSPTAIICKINYVYNRKFGQEDIICLI